MTRDEIVKAVNQAFVDVLEADEADLEPEKELFADLSMDSLDMVDLMISLQRKFGISLRNNKEIKKIRTLGDVYSFFEKMEAEHSANSPSPAEGDAKKQTNGDRQSAGAENRPE